MRAIPYLLILLLASLQALVTVYWMKTNAPQQFADVFKAFHGGIPAWTALAFSIGWFWLVLPLASLAWLFRAWKVKEQGRNPWTIATASLLAFVSMLYAMYPLHLMLAGS